MLRHHFIPGSRGDDLVLELAHKIDSGIMSALEWATSTKGAFYALNVLIIAAVIANPPTTIQGWLLVIVSEYYQGVALPGLGAGTKKTEAANKEENEKTRQLLQETHDAAIAEIAQLREIHEANAQELAEIKEIHRELHERYDRLVQVLETMFGGDIGA